MTGYGLLLLTSLLTCAGQLCQKQAANRWQALPPQAGRFTVVLFWLFCACLLLGLGMLFWLGVLRHLPVGRAYPMLSVNFVLVALAARCIFGETISPRRWGGIAAVTAGVLLMGLGR